jgi:ribose 5-phosphate isomerase B
MRIALGADHAGFPLKTEVVRFLEKEGHQVVDLGTHSTEPVDYPDYAKAVGTAVQRGQVERGILVCGSGVGACVAANKLQGIRAALCHDTYTAHQGVEHDDVNVLCLGGRVVGPALAFDILKAWLGARFSQGERHRRRVAKIVELEKIEG